MYRKISVIASAFILCSLFVQAQRLMVSGKVLSSGGNPVASAPVTLTPLNTTVLTDDSGFYAFRNLRPGDYRIVVNALQYLAAERTFVLGNADLQLDISLQPKVVTLHSIDINAQAKTLGITRLKDVDENGIYAGKKSEVIVMNDITANTATNNARQIYGKVAGLNIYENDGGAGIQLAIGGRGLDPNRVSNFNNPAKTDMISVPMRWGIPRAIIRRLPKHWTGSRL